MRKAAVPPPDFYSMLPMPSISTCYKSRGAGLCAILDIDLDDSKKEEPPTGKDQFVASAVPVSTSTAPAPTTLLGCLRASAGLVNALPASAVGGTICEQPPGSPSLLNTSSNKKQTAQLDFSSKPMATKVSAQKHTKSRRPRTAEEDRLAALGFAKTTTEDRAADSTNTLAPDRAERVIATGVTRLSQGGEWVTSTVATIANNGVNLGDFDFGQVFAFFDGILDEHPQAQQDDGFPLPIDAAPILNPLEQFETIDMESLCLSIRSTDEEGYASDDTNDPLNGLANMEDTMFFF